MRGPKRMLQEEDMRRIAEAMGPGATLFTTGSVTISAAQALRYSTTVSGSASVRKQTLSLPVPED